MRTPQLRRALPGVAIICSAGLVCACLRITQVLLLAFSSYSFTANGTGRLLPIIVLFFLVVRLFLMRRWVVAPITAVAGIASFVSLQSISDDGAIQFIYNTQIKLSHNYAAGCRPRDGVRADHAVLRVCESHDWDLGAADVDVIQVTGDPTDLLDHTLDRPPSRLPGPLEKLPVLFGVEHYCILPLVPPYYLVLFDSLPPGYPAKCEE